MSAPEDYPVELTTKYLTQKTFAEVFVPMAEDFARSGLRFEELDVFIDGVRNAIHEE